MDLWENLTVAWIFFSFKFTDLDYFILNIQTGSKPQQRWYSETTHICKIMRDCFYDPQNFLQMDNTIIDHSFD